MQMGEAKRRRETATGTLMVGANSERRFEWTGTRADSIALQKRFLQAAEFFPHGAQSYAWRAAGYLIVFGLPKAGDPDQRPSRLGETWEQNEIDAYKAAVLWLALREHVPDTGNKLED